MSLSWSFFEMRALPQDLKWSTNDPYMNHIANSEIICSNEILLEQENSTESSDCEIWSVNVGITGNACNTGVYVHPCLKLIALQKSSMHHSVVFRSTAHTLAMYSVIMHSVGESSTTPMRAMRFGCLSVLVERRNNIAYSASNRSAL